MRYTTFSRGIIAGLAFVLAFILAACQNEASNPLSSHASTATIGQTSGTEGSAGQLSLSKSPITQRPLSDFLNAQTSTFFWYDSEHPEYYLIADYFGQYNKVYGLNLGTTFTGTVTEQAQNDGTAKVVVDVTVTNALTWATTTSFVPVFGATGFQVKFQSGTPVLGTVRLRWEFTNPAPGAPIPSYVGAPGTTMLHFQAEAFGPVTAAYGLAPAGTMAKAWTNQTGLFKVLPKTNTPLDDGYAAEFVKISTVGQ
jgi:hypothetical protein